MTELSQITDEAMADSGLHPDQYDPAYLRREEHARNSLIRFYQQEIELRRSIKANVDLDEEARSDLYRQRHQQILGNFYREADAWTESHLQSRLAAYRQLHAGSGGSAGDEFADHLTKAAAMSDETLQRTYRVAKRSGSRVLCQALAQVAHDRSLTGGEGRQVFEDWSSSDPVRSDALRLLHQTPGRETTYTRIQVAMKPPTLSDPRLLQPSQEDYQRAEEKKRQEVRERRDFFNSSNGPQRRRGRGARG